jgi:uncharacterized protein (DUF305 family)
MRINVRIAALAGAVALSMTLAACGGGTSASSSTSASTSSGASTSSAVATTHNAADVSFSQAMIVHHQGAIAMAKLAVTRASTQGVKDLASRIEAAQSPEIAEMTAWLKAWGQPVSAGASMSGMSGMDPSSGSMSSGSASSGSTSSGSMGMSDAQMKELAAASGTAFDRMFLQMMTTHHQSAIQMAKSEQADGSNTQALALAKSIETSQTAEVAEMGKMLQNLGS